MPPKISLILQAFIFEYSVSTLQTCWAAHKWCATSSPLLSKMAAICLTREKFEEADPSYSGVGSQTGPPGDKKRSAMLQVCSVPQQKRNGASDHLHRLLNFCLVLSVRQPDSAIRAISQKVFRRMVAVKTHKYRG